jgi:hypothetical protein
VRFLEDLLMRIHISRTALATVVLASTFAVAADPANQGVKSAVEQVLHTQQDAWNRHDLEGFMAGYWNSPDLTFFSGVHETSGWQGALERYRKAYQGEGKEMGAGVLRITRRIDRNRLGLRARDVAFDHVRREDAPRFIHSDLPAISRGVENHPRPHVGGRVSTCTWRS